MKKPSAKQRLTDGAALIGATQPMRVDIPGTRRNVADLAGDSASESTLATLERAMAELKALKIAPFLQRSVECIRLEDAVGAGEWAVKALECDEKNGIAWRLLGISREKLGDFATAITCYETALTQLTDQGEIANDIGRLAYRLDQKDVAAKLFAYFCNAHPEIPDGANNLACVLRDQNRYAEAIDALKAALGRHPENPLLWNTLGSVLCEQGDPATALTFFEESLRLDPAHAKARYNRGNALHALSRFDEALVDCEAAMAIAKDPTDLAMMRLSRSTIRLCLGRVAEGWDDYEARFDPHFAGVTQFLINRPKWTPGDDLNGKSLLLIGEQGLGDEVLFANTIPDIVKALGPAGKLSIALEPRLVSLFQRSFPTANIGAHVTYNVNGQTIRTIPFLGDHKDIDLWAPLASPLRRFRTSHAAFPDRPRFLIPDEGRIAHWREVLKTAPEGLKAGILWKSMKLSGSRHGHFSPFEQWAPILTTPGVCFVNLQYGDCAEDLAQAKAELGVDIWTPPGIDLKNDLDDLASLCCALDLIIGFANATTNIAAASGANVWLIGAPGSWVQMGARRHLWYQQVRLFTRPVDGEWDDVMGETAVALAKSSPSPMEHKPG